MSVPATRCRSAWRSIADESGRQYSVFMSRSLHVGGRWPEGTCKQFDRMSQRNLPLFAAPFMATHDRNRVNSLARGNPKTLLKRMNELFVFLGNHCKQFGGVIAFVFDRKDQVNAVGSAVAVFV